MSDDLPETMYLLMRVTRWETMKLNIGYPVGRPADAPDCVGFCLVFATQEAAVEAAEDGEKIVAVRQSHE